MKKRGRPSIRSVVDFIAAVAMLAAVSEQSGESVQTVLLVVRSTCRYCTESMPFYRDILRQRSEARVILAGHEPAHVLAAYAALHDVSPDEVISISPDRLPVAGTPTLLVLDSTSSVTARWEGVLSKREQGRLLRQVR